MRRLCGSCKGDRLYPDCRRDPDNPCGTLLFAGSGDSCRAVRNRDRDGPELPRLLTDGFILRPINVAGDAYLTEEVGRFVPEGLTEFFVPAGRFEGHDLMRMRRLR